ncbi:hypothetical protein EMIT0P12_40146 [Pseudomonas sp. IT-P12]
MCSARKTVAHSRGFGSIYLFSKSVLVRCSKLKLYINVNLMDVEVYALGGILFVLT